MSPATPGLPETCPVCVVIPCPFHAAASDVLAALANLVADIERRGFNASNESLSNARAEIAKAKGDHP